MPIKFNPMGPHMGEVEIDTPQWHEAVCRHLQVLYKNKARVNNVDIWENLKRIWEHESWKYVPDEKGTPLQVFCEELIEEPWPVLIAIINDVDPEFACDIQAAINPGSGGDRKSADFKSDNVTFDPVERGNALPYTLNRLKRDFPELFGEVRSGNLTANKAAILAGIRPKVIQISERTPVEKAAESIQKILGVEKTAELKELL